MRILPGNVRRKEGSVGRSALPGRSDRWSGWGGPITSAWTRRNFRTRVGQPPLGRPKPAHPCSQISRQRSESRTKTGAPQDCQLSIVSCGLYLHLVKVRHCHHHPGRSRERIVANPGPARPAETAAGSCETGTMKRSAVWGRSLAFSVPKGPSLKSHGIRTRLSLLLPRQIPALFGCRTRSAPFSGVHRPSSQRQQHLGPMGSDSKMNEDYVLARFDRLVEEGTVVYNDDYRTVVVSDHGLPVR